MYIYDRQLSDEEQSGERPTVLRPSRRYYYGSDPARKVSWGSGGREYGAPGRRRLSGPDDKKPERKGTLVLYVRPTSPRSRVFDKVEHNWSFDMQGGQSEYETALHTHLKDKSVVSGDTVYQPLSGSADIAKFADSKFKNLVLIVHGASNAPAIAVDLGSAAAGTKGDWIRADAFATAIAPFAFEKITILGCDSISNKFTPNLANLLPKGSTVVGHEGGSFEITRHFERNKSVRGRLALTHVRSNLNLKSFSTKGKSP